jgi:hypothetical protein
VRGGVIEIDIPLTLALSPIGGEGKNQRIYYSWGFDRFDRPLL